LRIPNIGVGITIENKDIITATLLEGSYYYLQLTQNMAIKKIPMIECFVKYDWGANNTTFCLMGGANIPIKRFAINISAGFAYNSKISLAFSVRLKYNLRLKK